MTDLKLQLTKLFEETFNAQPNHFFQAPGRVNLIGEHTDYNDGFVLPCAIDYQTMIAASLREDDKVVVTAANYDGQKTEFVLNRPIPASKGAKWSNYLRGVATTLLKKGYSVKGANLAIAGNVPQGAGLSSSASLEVVTGLALSRLSGLEISLKDLALTGQEAENHYVGVNCGIMDQMVSALGENDHAMLLDCRSLDTRSVAIPEDAAVVIINSNKKRGLVDSEYNTRRSQCEQVASHFKVKALRDISLEDLEEQKSQLDELAYRQARHVITENARTLTAAEVLPTGNLKLMGQLMAQSHASMRDDFEITVPQIDAIVEIVKGVIGERGGVRMTGGGFGGCVVALAPTDLVDDIQSAIDQQYFDRTGLTADIYVCNASQGTSVLI
ncbi:MAG: galactokinase [Endozoicomonas sp.]|uniref:galactokinase n=1 Tax=Endozoicomonas sp. TaxID=1892382 RepID=UPI003D9BA58F